MKRIPLLYLFCVLPLTLLGQVKSGADLLMTKNLDVIAGKRVGLVTNHTGVLSSGQHLADALHTHPGTRLVALFGPEHGIRGDAPDGAQRRDTVDASTGVPVYSLYGQTYKPTPEMLKGIDVLLYDIQDIGARFYTYISTLSYAMEAAAENGIPFVVLDRPDPIRGIRVEGYVRDDAHRSFVGLQPIPIAYGMTSGELATMFNNEGWLAGGVKARLTVIRMEGWNREMWYDESGLPWIAPSPNMPFASTAVVYPGMCLVEGTVLSEGRGTDRPFEYVGAPFVNGTDLAAALNRANLPGVVFEPVEFTPVVIPGKTSNPKFMNRNCEGVFIKVTDRDRYEPVRAGVTLLSTVKKLYPAEFQWREKGIDRLAGTSRLRESIDRGLAPEAVVQQWQDEVKTFLKVRTNYLLYN